MTTVRPAASGKCRTTRSRSARVTQMSRLDAGDDPAAHRAVDRMQRRTQPAVPGAVVVRREHQRGVVGERGRQRRERVVAVRVQQVVPAGVGAQPVPEGDREAVVGGRDGEREAPDQHAVQRLLGRGGVLGEHLDLVAGRDQGRAQPPAVGLDPADVGVVRAGDDADPHRVRSATRRRARLRGAAIPGRWSAAPVRRRAPRSGCSRRGCGRARSWHLGDPQPGPATAAG